MALKLNTKQRILAAIAGAGVLFVLYDQVVNFGPAKAGATSPEASHSDVDPGNASVQDAPRPTTATSTALPAPTTPAPPGAADRLRALEVAMGTWPSQERLIDLFARDREGARGTSSSTTTDPTHRVADARRAEQLARLFTLRSVMDKHAGGSAGVNDVVLTIGRPTRVRVGDQEYTLELVSVHPPQAADRGSAMVRVDGELVTLRVPIDRANDRK